MAFQAHKNLSVGTVSTAPTTPTAGTALAVTAGQGARFPAVPFMATVCAANTRPTPANAEIVQVTNIATDLLTIVRAQEGTVARTIVVGDIIEATATAKSFTDIEAGTNFPVLAAATTMAAGTTVTAGTVVEGSTLRATGPTTAAAGAGIELLYVTNIGIIQAYDRTGAAFKPIQFAGSTVELQIAAVTKVKVGALGGVTVGAAPAGGDKGTGTINCAADIYKNNTAFTNPKWALKKHFTGEMDTDGPYAGPADYQGLLPLDEHEAITRAQHDLPLMLRDPEGGMFARGDLLLASLEEAYLYIYQLHRRLEALEEKSAPFTPGAKRTAKKGRGV